MAFFKDNLQIRVRLRDAVKGKSHDTHSVLRWAWKGSKWYTEKQLNFNCRCNISRCLGVLTSLHIFTTKMWEVLHRRFIWVGTWISFHPWETLRKRLPVAVTYDRVPSASLAVLCIMISRLENVFSWRTKKRENAVTICGNIGTDLQLQMRMHVCVVYGVLSCKCLTWGSTTWPEETW